MILIKASVLAATFILMVSCEEQKDEPIIVIDIDGNTYQTVMIGEQLWMSNNLKVTHYRNGDSIYAWQSISDWSSHPGGAYAVYDDSIINADTYGLLYNWHAVNNVRKIAPEGWHVPTDEEWIELIEYLGGEDIAGGKLKEAGNAHWIKPIGKIKATNESGFTALPGGYRHKYGYYSMLKYDGCFWSSSETDSLDASFWELFYWENIIRNGYNSKDFGFSVRCVKD